MLAAMLALTQILDRAVAGDPTAAEELLPLVYGELRRLAAARLAQEKPGQTLQATALVHEAYLRLVGNQEPGTRTQEPEDQPLASGPRPLAPGWHSRGHFFAAAAEAMRRILIDLARQKRSERHGGGRQRCELSDDDRVTFPVSDELLDLDEALTRLAATDPQAADMVKLRIFAGLSVEEAAAVQGISTRTAKRDWAYARAWLGRALADP
jgi:RNA polymerase sigma factor (sigma-70 family)